MTLYRIRVALRTDDRVQAVSGIRKVGFATSRGNLQKDAKSMTPSFFPAGKRYSALESAARARAHVPRRSDLRTCPPTVTFPRVLRAFTMSLRGAGSLERVKARVGVRLICAGVGAARCVIQRGFSRADRALVEVRGARRLDQARPRGKK